MRSGIRLAVAAVVLVALVAGCSTQSSETVVVGVVTQVSGDLGAVESFVVTDTEGRAHQFTPTQGLMFDGGPIDHLREHIVSGVPVEVRFEESDTGALIAVEVTDAG